MDDVLYVHRFFNQSVVYYTNNIVEVYNINNQRTDQFNYDIKYDNKDNIYVLYYKHIYSEYWIRQNKNQEYNIQEIISNIQHALIEKHLLTN